MEVNSRGIDIQSTEYILLNSMEISEFGRGWVALNRAYMKPASEARSAGDLFAEFAAHRWEQGGERINFAGVEGKDVYNISAPFMDEGDTVIAGRVEARDSEDSEVVFFVQRGGVWFPRTGTRRFPLLQDPFVAVIQGELVFGGVEIWRRFTDPHKLEFRTLFYRGKNIRDLRLCAVGLQGMKDIRLVELTDKRIGVFTRPKGRGFGGKAEIGFAVIDCLDDLTPSVIVQAKKIPRRFLPEEWGGVNELHVLRNGRIGILGHIAHFTEDHLRHYYAMSFVWDSTTEHATSIKVIAASSSFINVQNYKRPDLRDVIFPGGLVRWGDGRADLYAGVNDCEAYKLRIHDPFLDYED